MTSLVALIALLAPAQAEPPLLTITEPRPPELLSAGFEARCEGRTLALQGAGARRPTSDAPLLKLDGQNVVLPPAALAFLSADRSAYRFAAVCDRGGAFHVKLNRVSGTADGALSFDVHAFDVDGQGKLTDRGGQKGTAEGFSYR